MFLELDKIIDILIKKGIYKSRSGNARNSIINFHRLIIKIVLKKSYSDIRKENRIKGGKSIKKYLSKGDIKKISNIERQIIKLLKGGLNYSDIKNINLITY